MIRSVRGAATRQFLESGKAKFSGLDVQIAVDRLNQINAATSLETFGRLASVGLHKLKGDRKDFWAVKVNGPWRIIFRFEDGDAFDVEILDYH